jgi:hypothetical protein
MEKAFIQSPKNLHYNKFQSQKKIFYTVYHWNKLNLISLNYDTFDLWYNLI